MMKHKEQIEKNLEAVRTVASLNNLSNFAEEIIEKQERDLGNFKRDFFPAKKIYQISTLEYGIKNIFDLSQFIPVLSKNQPQYRQVDLIVNKSDYKKFQQDFLLNTFSRYKSENINYQSKSDIYKNSEFSIKYHYSEFSEIHGDYFIFRPEWAFYSLPEKWQNSLGKMAKQIWLKSLFQKEIYLKSGYPEQKLKILPPGIDSEYYCPGKSKLKLNTNKKFKLLYFGNFGYPGGLDILLEAYSEAFTAKDDLCLIIQNDWNTGETDNRRILELISRLKENPLCPEIIITEAQEALELYRASDCFVYPFRSDLFPERILEALACELPVITSEAAFVKDLNLPGSVHVIKADYLKIEYQSFWGEPLSEKLPFFITDKDSLKEKLKSVFQLRPKINPISREYIKENFSWDKIFKLIDNYLENN